MARLYPRGRGGERPGSDRDRAHRPDVTRCGAGLAGLGADATYRVDIEGDPDIHCAMTLGEAEGMERDTRRWPRPPCGS